MEQIAFIKPIIALRVLQLYYHNAHLLVKGPTFLSDHNLLSEFYKGIELEFDSLSEYMIATLGTNSYDTVAIANILSEKLAMLGPAYNDTTMMYSVALQLEQELQATLIELNSQATLGLQNLIGAIAEASDIRKYKIQQRVS